jgi:urease accessory protein
MICEAVIGTALRSDGSTSLPTLGSSPPIKLMNTPEGIYVVGAAASPLNGDRISLEIYVAPGTELKVRTVAASLAWPGTSPVPSQFTINAKIGEGASLHWLPEPFVPVAGSLHRMVANVEVADGGEVVWREEIVHGRHNERPGELSSRLEITYANVPLLRQDLVVGAGHFESPAVLGSAGATGSVTIAGREPIARLKGLPEDGADEFPSANDNGEAAILELEAGGQQVVATAADSIRLRKLLDLGTSAVLSNSSRPAGATLRSEHVQLGN